MKTITVTAEDISQGQPWLCSLCPLALAIRRATGSEALVGERMVYFQTDYRVTGNAALPLVAQNWRTRYDASNGTVGEPFEFTITLP